MKARESVLKVGGLYSAHKESATDWANQTGSTNQFRTVTSIVLEPGRWVLNAHLGTKPNASGTTGNTYAGLAINTTTNSGSGTADVVSRMYRPRAVSATESVWFEFPGMVVNPTSETTYYLICQTNWSDNPPQVRGRISARRLN